VNAELAQFAQHNGYRAILDILHYRESQMIDETLTAAPGLAEEFRVRASECRQIAALLDFETKRIERDDRERISHDERLRKLKDWNDQRVGRRGLIG
jgi:hypothetical protein